MFWRYLPRPFFVLAPMANVTDFAFRSMIAKYGKPDVMWNEFVSADGLCSVGKEKLMIDLKFSDKERPIVAQLFTGHPKEMKEAAKLCAELGFDGLDINMGCPDRAVEKQGGGSALIREPKKALQVLQSAREGWLEILIGNMSRAKTAKNNFDSSLISGKDLPISIKTRLGYNKIDLDWLKFLFEQNLPALTIHLRTRKEMSDVPAHWELVPEIVRLRDEAQKGVSVEQRTLIIGNGDVQTVVEGFDKCMKYGCDGIMIGRGIFGTPWLFENIGNQKSGDPTKHRTASSIQDVTIKTPEYRLKVMLEHTKFFEKEYCGKKKLKNFSVMKKHFKAYVSGWDGAKELRAKLMETDNYNQVKNIVDEHFHTTH